MLATCCALDIAFIAFSPLARGMLAGSIRDDGYARGDIRASMPRFIKPQLTRNLELVDAFIDVAKNVGLTAAQLALAWVLSRNPAMIALPGTCSIRHLEENVATLSMPIYADTLARVGGMFAPGQVHGPRYPKAAQAQIDTELLEGEPLD